MLLSEKDLTPIADLGHARALLERWHAPDREQAITRDRIVDWIARHPLDAHLRECSAGHLTASALVVDHEGRRALLTHHKKLGRWLQLGGHCDGDANLARVALREAIEESGIEGLLIESEPIDVDVHVIPARADEPRHLHLDTRFVVHAPRAARAIVSDESNELRWFAPSDLAHIQTDDSVKRLFQAVFGRGPRATGVSNGG